MVDLSEIPEMRKLNKYFGVSPEEMETLGRLDEDDEDGEDDEDDEDGEDGEDGEDVDPFKELKTLVPVVVICRKAIKHFESRNWSTKERREVEEELSEERGLFDLAVDSFEELSAVVADMQRKFREIDEILATM